MGFYKSTESKIEKYSEGELFSQLYYSLNGFYKPEYDSYHPEEIYNLYLKRKEVLLKGNRNEYKMTKDSMLQKMAIKFESTCIGFFRDKQDKRIYKLTK